MRFKKGSAAAKAFMAKLRARIGRTAHSNPYRPKKSGRRTRKRSVVRVVRRMRIRHARRGSRGIFGGGMLGKLLAGAAGAFIKRRVLGGAYGTIGDVGAGAAVSLVTGGGMNGALIGAAGGAIEGMIIEPMMGGSRGTAVTGNVSVYS